MTKIAQIDPTEIANARVAVARGVKLLDEKVPDWRSRIDKELLDMSQGRVCILGQAFADAFGKLDLSGYGYIELDDATIYNGFELGIKELGIDGEEYGFESFDGVEEQVYDEVNDEYDYVRVGNFGYPALGRAWEEELWPEMFVVTVTMLEGAIADLRDELPGLIGKGLREVLRSL